MSSIGFKLNPVRRIPQPEIVQIGSPFIGFVSMIKRGMVMVDEDPDELQDGNAKRVATQALLMEAQLRLADERGVSFDDAGRLLSGASINEPDEPDEFESSNSPIVKVQANEKIDLFKYFTLDEKKQWLQLLSDAKQTKLIAATLFMQTRFVYAFEVANRVSPGLDTLHIEPVDFPIVKDDRIMIDGHEVQSLFDVIPGQTVLRLKSPLTQGIEAQTVCHLLDFKTGRIKTGVPAWTLDDTKHWLSQDMVDAIFEFYQEERSAPSKLLESAMKESEGNATLAASLPLSSASQPSLPSTGMPSTGESSPTASEMNGSAQKTLEAALPG